VDDALTSDYPLEAHLWRHVVQYGAEAQSIFRTLRHYHTRARNLQPARCQARGGNVLHVVASLRRAERSHTLDAGPDLAVHPRRVRPAFGIRAGVVATLVLAAGLLGRQVAPV
jgi:hypothetical protein